MAARLNRRHQATVREKIRASQLINALQNHVFGKRKKRLDSTQVTAALGLLKKCLPDMASIEGPGDDKELVVRIVD
jgi:hypothetical protein